MSKIADSFLTNFSNVVKHIFKANIFSYLYLDRFISYIMLMAWESRKIRQKFAFLPVSNFNVIYVFHLNRKMFFCFNIQVPCIVTKYWYIALILQIYMEYGSCEGLDRHYRCCIVVRLIGRAAILVIMYGEISKTDVIVLIGNVMECLMSHWPINI